jgi:tRNA(fMet)-specific endonuclease VapC
VLILDTDHLSEFERGSPAGERLVARLDASDEEVAATIISAEEQMRGWLAQIHRLSNDPHAQVLAYTRLQGRFDFYINWLVLPWTVRAADLFPMLRRQGVRIGSMDLKIASIALEHGATFA